MTTSIFSKNLSVRTAADDAIDTLAQNFPDMNVGASPQLAANMISLESAGPMIVSDLERTYNNLRHSLEQMAAENKAIAHNVGQTTLGDGSVRYTTRVSQESLTAGALAGILASNIPAATNRKLDTTNRVSTENYRVVSPSGLPDAFDERWKPATEAYDERENRAATLYTIVYNMQAALQDEFGETWFPTMTISPDKVGVDIEVQLMYVFDGFRSKMEAGWQDWKRRNIIRAVVDPNILRKDATRIVPVHRAQYASVFVNPSDVPVQTIQFEGEDIQTAPIKFGTKVNLKNISQTAALLANGVLDETDAIDPSMDMTNVYVKIDGNVLKINLSNLPRANFKHMVQGNDRKMALNFDTTSILINKNTKQADGSALVNALGGIVTNDLIVRVEMRLNGDFNIQDGNGVLYANSMEVYSVQDAQGVTLSLSAAPAVAVATAINSAGAAGVLGYDCPKAYWTNVNRRQTGQFVDTQRLIQSYTVPLRAPITSKRPTTIDASTETFDVNSLIQLTRTRIQNEAVTSLINAFALMKDYVESRDTAGEGPEILGVGRHYVRSAYIERDVDMSVSVDSLSSHQRAEDMQATLVNHLRDIVFNLFRDSEYKPAADYLRGGPSEVPTVIIGTDPVLARYLTVTGDLRTLGGEFNCRVVSSFDQRMEGKIFIGFSSLEEGRNSVIYPLNFGNMFWGPEVVLNANIPRNGSLSKETLVQPRYLFVTHCPIGGLINVSNMSDVLNKLPVHFHNV